jgi:hypothetical protein
VSRLLFGTLEFSPRGARAQFDRQVGDIGWTTNADQRAVTTRRRFAKSTKWCGRAVDSQSTVISRLLFPT